MILLYPIGLRFVMPEIYEYWLIDWLTYCDSVWWSLIWQMVWAKSYALGCSLVQCERLRSEQNTHFDNVFFTVCHYGPTYAMPYYVYICIVLLSVSYGRHPLWFRAHLFCFIDVIFSGFLGIAQPCFWKFCLMMWIYMATTEKRPAPDKYAHKPWDYIAFWH